MTQEDKDLLIKDLCARLPYGVKIEITWWVMGEGTYMNTTLEPDHIEQLLNDDDTEIKPYLRSMSSMTEEEEREYNGMLTQLGDFMFEQEEQFKPIQLYKNIPFELYDFFNAHHFDYRGLIPKGLAIEAPDGMYN